jgi:hypothetical protein
MASLSSLVPCSQEMLKSVAREKNNSTLFEWRICIEGNTFNNIDSRPQRLLFMNVRNKLECLYLAGLSSLVPSVM